MEKVNSQGDATELIDRYIEGMADWRGKLLGKVRKVFLETDPDIVEEWKWMGSPAWSKNGLIAVGNAHKDKIKLTFSQGAHLQDINNLFNSGLGGKQWRAIDLFKGDDIDESKLKDLIFAAISYNLSK